jgi:hypothetical protein
MDRRDGCPDALEFQGAAILDQHPSDASPEVRTAWDAWDDAHLAATADGILEAPLPGADVGRSADLEPDAPAQDG